MKKTIISFILTFVLLITLGTISALADEADFITAEYTYVSSDGSETSGLEVVSYNGNETDIYIPSKIGDIPVLKVGDNFLKDNTSVNSVTLGAGIKEIGAGAFSGATNMVCALLNEDIETIGAGAFSNMPVFNSVILWDGIVSIGEGAFVACTELTVYCNEGTAAYEYVTANGVDYEILNPESVPETYIVDGITYYIQNGVAIAVNCDESVVNILMPATVQGYPVKEIRGVFSNCTEIVSVVLPGSLQIIEEYLFQNCTSLTNVVIPDSVTTIENFAFYNCTGLVSVNVPDGVKTIGVSAFENCTGLVSVYLPDTLSDIGTRIFSGCKSLTSVQLPTNLKTISKDMFFNCISLKNIQIPDSVTEINEYAFAYCKSLTKVEIPEGITEIKSHTFFDCASLVSVNIPKDVTKIGQSAFEGCTSLFCLIIHDKVTKIEHISNYYHAFDSKTTLVVYPNSYAHTFAINNGYTYLTIDKNATSEVVTLDGITYFLAENKATVIGFDNSKAEVEIPETVKGYAVVALSPAFSESKTLTSISLPSTLKTISPNAFYCCTKLTEIEIPEGVTSIGYKAFEGCVALTNVVLPDSLKSIGYNAFYECKNLLSINIPAGVTIIEKQTFKNCSKLQSLSLSEGLRTVDNEAFMGCSGLKSVTFLDGIKTIAERAFYNCTSLRNVSFSGGLTTIKTYAFSNCTNLVSVEFPDSLTSLGHSAFRDCTGLTYVKLSAGLASTGDYVFYNCCNLESVDIPYGLKSIGSDVFYLCTKLKNIEIPESLTYIGPRAFVGCNSLNMLSIPENVTQLSSSAFPSSVILIVNEDSVAHSFAVSNGFMFILADENSNSKVYEIDGVIYFVSDQKAKAVGYNNSSYTVTIPETVGGCPVTELFETFKDCSNIRQVVLPRTLKTIGENAFYNCTNLTSVEIKEGVTTIGKYAFYNCSKLADIKIPEGVKIIGERAFSNCSYLSNVELPETVTDIGIYAFYNCDALKHIDIPDGITSLKSGVFQDSGLQTVIFPSNLTELGSSVFQLTNLRTIEFPSTLKYIGNSAFQQCITLSNVTIPGNVITVGDRAFMNCHLLNNVVIQDGVKTIGEKAFFECTYLKTVTIADSVTTIGESAFENSPNLTDVDMSNSVKTIQPKTFLNCTALKNVTLPSELLVIGSQAFDGCESLVNIDIPESTTKISTFAFAGCTSLAYVELPDSITNIEMLAFSFCSALESVYLPSNITTINEGSFKNCSSLTKIEIPNSVSIIGSNAFNGCTSLANVIIPDSVTTIAGTAFSDCPNLKTVLVSENVTAIQSNSFPNSTILLVYQSSYVHEFCMNNNLLYHVIREVSNPEISYGTSISGTVSYTDGSTASGITIDILYDDGELKESTKTDVNGNYEFTYAEVGKYTIRVSDGSNTASEQVSVKRKNVFDVILTGETDLVLKKGYNVNVNVTGEVPVTVTLSDTNGNAVSSVSTDSSSVTFENVSPGDYIVKAENDDGSALAEITVFKEDVGVNLTIEGKYVVLFGKVVVKDRENQEHERGWAQITVYNADGVIAASGKTDENGNYSFEKLLFGEYTVKAEVTEMREDEYYGYIRPYVLKGYAYVNAAEAGEYEIETIVLKEEETERVSISGKVTAQGENQACEVILMNENRDELARFETKKNGKYKFDKVRDGYYILCAITNNDGAGFTEITVKDGTVYGETDIRVYKSDRVSAHEAEMLNIPDCETKAEAEQYRENVMSEKNFYDSIPDKEKKMLSEWYISKLDKLVQLLSGYEFTCEGAEVDGGGLIVSEEEVSTGANPHFTISVVEMDKWEKNKGGIETDEDYYQTFVEEAAGDNELAQYYDITLECEKNGKTYEITDIKKHTDTTGKIRLTMPIPDKFKGHKNYAFVHVHNGVPTTLVDLDDDPDTITFEIDRFSTFALMFNDEEQADLSDYATLDVVNNTLTATSTTDATLFVATYEEGGRMTDVKLATLNANTPIQVSVSAGQKAFVLDSTMLPLCEEVVVG